MEKESCFIREFFLWLIPDIFCFIDFIFHCRTCSLLVFSYNRKILATWKTLHSTLRKCFGYLIHSAIVHFASPLYNSPSQQNWKLLCHSKMFLHIFCSSSKTISLAEQWKQLINIHKTQISTNRKNLLRARITVLGTAVMYYCRILHM